jgi:hypothetical protein
MSGHSQQTAASDDTETIAIPCVGTVERTEHTPIEPRQWPNTISEVTDHYRDVRHSHAISLVGLDEVGRGVYHDSRNHRVVVVFPYGHHAFRNDVKYEEWSENGNALRELERRTLSTYDPLRGPANPNHSAADAPTAGTRLVIHEQEKVCTPTHPSPNTQYLAEWVAQRAVQDGWQFVTENMADRVSDAVEDLIEEGSLPDKAQDTWADIVDDCEYWWDLDA